jgi:hypothetical protein
MSDSISDGDVQVVKTSVAFTPEDFYNRLAEKVSLYNARLMVQSAMVRTGIARDQQNEVLAPELARDLCMQLISQGGPAFRVGQDIFRQLQ